MYVIFTHHINFFRILDSSCGDMTWMPTFLEGRNDIIFTGFDIVPENIQQHRNMFKHQNWSFEVGIIYMKIVST